MMNMDNEHLIKRIISLEGDVFRGQITESHLQYKIYTLKLELEHYNRPWYKKIMG